MDILKIKVAQRSNQFHKTFANYLSNLQRKYDGNTTFFFPLQIIPLIIFLQHVQNNQSELYWQVVEPTTTCEGKTLENSVVQPNT